MKFILKYLSQNFNVSVDLSSICVFSMMKTRGSFTSANVLCSRKGTLCRIHRTLSFILLEWPKVENSTVQSCL